MRGSRRTNEINTPRACVWLYTLNSTPPDTPALLFGERRVPVVHIRTGAVHRSTGRRERKARGRHDLGPERTEVQIRKIQATPSRPHRLRRIPQRTSLGWHDLRPELTEDQRRGRGRGARRARPLTLLLRRAPAECESAPYTSDKPQTHSHTLPPLPPPRTKTARPVASVDPATSRIWHCDHYAPFGHAADWDADLARSSDRTT